MKEKKPLISVIVPVYNVENYLHKCVDSILAQTLNDFELILVDDGSPDNCGDICDEYEKKDGRVKVIHKPNGGVSSARNAGIESARGEWLCFVDGDDFVDETYLADFRINNSDADMYLQGYKQTCNGKIVKQYDFSDLKSELLADIIAYTEDNYIINSPCFKLYKSITISSNKILFDIKTSYGEDHLFSLVYLLHVSTVSCSLAAGYNYRIAGESLTHSVKNNKQLTYYIVKSREYGMQIYDRMDEKSLLAAHNRRLVNNLKVFVYNFYKTGEGLKNYECSIREFRKKLDKYNYSLPLLDKVFLFLLLKVPCLVSYKLLDKYSNSK